MQKVLTIVFLTGCLFVQRASIAQTPSPTKFKGFLGTYHPVNGTAYGGAGWKEGELMQKAFDFGQNAILVTGSRHGYTFEENITNSCSEWDVNKIYGILLPPAEAGAVNQAKDLDLLKPFQRKPGMIQGAHRFSELSKRCPQIAGVIIDDFFSDFPKEITLEDLRALKDALMGKRMDKNGNVDSSSPATTPDLKLYIVVYEHQLGIKVEPQVLALLDGVSFWIWKQSEHYKQFDDYLETVNRLYPNKEVIAGVYVLNSKETPIVPSVHHIIERTIDLYAKGKVNGLLIFSAIWLSREESKRERWDELALPQFLGRLYYPFLGEGTGRVVEAKMKNPVGNALVSVNRIVGTKRLLTTRKFTNDRGEFSFGGWAGNGKKERVAYEIRIERESFKPSTMHVRLRAGESINLGDARLKLQ